ncbi:hypothetical protein ACP70R_008473 [Stipagrostis hirtigluma subsp. patula]
MYGGGSSYLEGEKMMPRQKTPAVSLRSEGGGKAKAASRELKRSVSMGGKLASAAREHKARLYIMRRCVSMLVRWKD